MQVQELAIADLVPYERNPRNNDNAVDAVAKSIKTFGFKIPIVIDKDNVVVCGHTRLKAAKKLKLKTAPCIVADDLTEEQIKAFRLADNKVGEIATWNDELLSLELQELELTDIDMSDFGFEDMDTIDLDVDAQEDEYEVPDDLPAKCQSGEVYQLGRHRLMCGDSTKQADVEKLMGGVEADLLLTDPPYNVDYQGGTKEKLKIKNDKMDSDEFASFLYAAFSNAYLAMKPGAAFYVWFASREHINFESQLKNANLEVRQEIIWKKSSLILGRQDYQWIHEPCLYGWKDGASHLWASDRKQTTVIEMDKPARSELHPTMKPIPLFDYQMKNNTKGGDVVLDLFGGSGTTLIAAEQNGRKAYLMEFDPHYADVIVDRWEKLTGNKAEKIEE